MCLIVTSVITEDIVPMVPVSVFPGIQESVVKLRKMKLQLILSTVPLPLPLIIIRSSPIQLPHTLALQY